MWIDVDDLVERVGYRVNEKLKCCVNCKYGEVDYENMYCHLFDDPETDTFEAAVDWTGICKKFKLKHTENV